MFDDLQILVLDDKDTAEMTDKLRKLYPGAKPQSVNCVSEAKRRFKLQNWDIVVLDINMHDDTELLESYRKTGGFLAYFDLRKNFLGNAQIALPPLVILYTGQEDLQEILSPFFVDDEDLSGRPFSIINRAKDKDISLLRDYLIRLEVDRFQDSFKWLYSGSEADAYLPQLTRPSPDALKLALCNIVMSSTNVRFKTVFPTLVGQIVDGKYSYARRLATVLKNQNWLAKLNYLFHKRQPGGDFTHGNIGQWNALVRRLSILPAIVSQELYQDMHVSPPTQGKGNAAPIFIETSYLDASESFKAKWSCWDKESNEYIKTDGEVGHAETLIGAVFAVVKAVCSQKSGVSPQLQFIRPNDSIRRLYLRPFIPIRIAKEAAHNSVTKNNVLSKIIVRVVQDQEASSLCLDIVDDGEGFDPKVVTWQSAFSEWQRELLGWGVLEVYVKHEGTTWLMKEGGTVLAEFPNASASEGKEFGVLVRLRFTYRHDWDYGT